MSKIIKYRSELSPKKEKKKMYKMNHTWQLWILFLFIKIIKLKKHEISHKFIDWNCYLLALVKGKKWSKLSSQNMTFLHNKFVIFNYKFYHCFFNSNVDNIQSYSFLWMKKKGHILVNHSKFNMLAQVKK